MQKLEIIETTKGKPLAIYGAYQYRQSRSNKENVVFWICMKERATHCRGSLKTKDEQVLHETIHTCDTNAFEIEIRRRLNNTKKRVKECDGKISQIFNKEMRPLYDIGNKYDINIPVFNSVKNALYRIRRKQQENINVAGEVIGEIVQPSEVAENLTIVDGNTEKTTEIKVEPIEKHEETRSEPEKTVENLEGYEEENEDDLQPSEIYEPVIEITSARKRPKKEYTESDILRSLLKRQREPPEEDDEDKMFLLSLLPSFKKMDEDIKFATRIEILQVVRRNLQTNYFPATSASAPIL